MATRRVTVEMHARAAELVGARRIDVVLDAAATGGDLKRELGLRHPKLAPLLESSVVATDREYLADASPLGEGDGFHLIPPVSGG